MNLLMLVKLFLNISNRLKFLLCYWQKKYISMGIFWQKLIRLKNVKLFPNFRSWLPILICQLFGISESVVNSTIRSAFGYGGQKCSACSRMYVPESKWEEVSCPASFSFQWAYKCIGRRCQSQIVQWRRCDATCRNIGIQNRRNFLPYRQLYLGRVTLKNVFLVKDGFFPGKKILPVLDTNIVTSYELRLPAEIFFIDSLT